VNECKPLDAGRAAAPAPTIATTSISFSPFFPKIFLAAHAGGAAALYSTDSSLALQRWDGITAGGSRSSWSPHQKLACGRPGIIHVSVVTSPSMIASM
jgi:hypothetical protein